MLVALAIVIGLVAGCAATVAALRLVAGSRLDAARRTRPLLLEEAQRDADATRREAQIEAREQAVKVRAELEAELRERRDDGRQDRGARPAEGGRHRPQADELTRREQGVADREIHLKELQEALKQHERPAAPRARAHLEADDGRGAGSGSSRSPRSRSATSSPGASGSSRRRPPARRSGAPATSSPTRCSGSRRAPPPRRRSRSSSCRPTT